MRCGLEPMWLAMSILRIALIEDPIEDALISLTVLVFFFCTVKFLLRVEDGSAFLPFFA